MSSGERMNKKYDKSWTKGEKEKWILKRTKQNSRNVNRYNDKRITKLEYRISTRQRMKNRMRQRKKGKIENIKSKLKNVDDILIEYPRIRKSLGWGNSFS